MIRTVIVFMALIGWSCVTPAQVMGSPPNPQSPSSPAYSPPAVKPAPDYHLPPIPETPDSSMPAVGGGKMFVSRIEVRGVTVFKPAVISEWVAPYEKREVTASELQTLRVALTRLYVDRGYINSGVLLPDQQSRDSVVVYQAVEGKLTRIEITGGRKLRPAYVSSRIRQRVAAPLKLSSLQTGLRRLQEDANISRLDARLGPGDELGEAYLRVKIEEPPRFTAGVGADNNLSPSIGATEGKVFFGARDLTGYGESFSGNVGRSRGNTAGSAILSVPVSPRDDTLQAFYSRGNAAIIQQPFKQLNIKESVRTYGVLATIPLIDRVTNRLQFFLGVESDRSYTELLGTGFSFSAGAQNGVSAVAVVSSGLDWLTHGRSSVTDLRLTYRRGIDALGATISHPTDNQLFNPNATGADGRFGLEQVQLIHIERLNGFAWFAKANDRAQLLLRFSGQLTQKPLLSLEKFTVGGVDTVRGVSQNLFVRDNGAAATLELQLPLPGFRSDASLMNLVLAPFIDYGRSWDKVDANAANSGATDPNADTSTARQLATAGIGLLWNPFRGFDAQIYWGRAIANNFGANDPRHFVPHDLQYHGLYFAVKYAVHW